MAVFANITSGDSRVINGRATVSRGDRTPAYYDLQPSGLHMQVFPSGSALNTFVVLDGRYKVPPTGWSA